MKWRRYFGPSTMVTAAFIGPGTVTMCTTVGVRTGSTLLWALVFSVLATIILQEMSARLGVVTRMGMGEALRERLPSGVVRLAVLVLVFSAIVVGNAAYEGGNLSGAVLGLQAWLGEGLASSGGSRVALPLTSLLSLLMGGIAFGVLYSGRVKVIEQVLVGLVGLMSVVFVSTMLLSSPNWSEVIRGLFVPNIPSGEMLLVVGLIGTTVVPYNLFLHASVVQERYAGSEDLANMRRENATAIILGGLISMSIIITSATNIQGSDIQSATDMAQALEPLLGAWAKYILGLGLFAAGISSAITAPLATAYALNGILGWGVGLQDHRFRAIWMAILGVGVMSASVGFSPIRVIQFAQVANGLLLPTMAGVLWWLTSSTEVMGEYVNDMKVRVLGILVILVTLMLASRSLWSVFGG
ncbi:MAG: manganese transporter [Balneola sp.]|nr:manganese transporter [Balneola sp.]